MTTRIIRAMAIGTILISLGCQGPSPRPISTATQDETKPRYTLEFRQRDGESITSNVEAFEVTTATGKNVIAQDGWLTVDGAREPIADGSAIVIAADGTVSVRRPEPSKPEN